MRSKYKETEKKWNEIKREKKPEQKDVTESHIGFHVEEWCGNVKSKTHVDTISIWSQKFCEFLYCCVCLLLAHASWTSTKLSLTFSLSLSYVFFLSISFSFSEWLCPSKLTNADIIRYACHLNREYQTIVAHSWWMCRVFLRAFFFFLCWFSSLCFCSRVLYISNHLPHHIFDSIQNGEMCWNGELRKCVAWWWKWKNKRKKTHTHTTWNQKRW